MTDKGSVVETLQKMHATVASLYGDESRDTEKADDFYATFLGLFKRAIPRAEAMERENTEMREHIRTCPILAKAKPTPRWASFEDGIDDGAALLDAEREASRVEKMERELVQLRELCRSKSVLLAEETRDIQVMERVVEAARRYDEAFSAKGLTLRAVSLRAQLHERHLELTDALFALDSLNQEAE